MARPAIDPVDRSINAYRALTAEDKVLYHRVLRHIGVDQPKPAPPAEPRRRRKPEAPQGE